MRNLINILLILCFFLGCRDSDSPEQKASKPKLTSAEISALELLRSRLNTQAEGVLKFWLEHGPDREFGGFLGRIDRQGRKAKPADKSIIQQSRHLWALSMWSARREGSTVVRNQAESIFKFIKDHFYDAQDGQFYYLTTESGKVLNKTKNICAQSFAIYALAEYSQAFNLEEPKQMALAAFRAIDAEAHDSQHGGYKETGNIGRVRAAATKSSDSNLHLLEALTNLYRVTRDATVKLRLKELVELMTTKLMQPSGYVHKEFADDWTPVGPAVVNYGHDLETSWLLVDAVQVAELQGAPHFQAAIKMAEHTARYGYDPLLGGFFLKGKPLGQTTEHEKVWWVQAEALLGLFRLYQLSGDKTHLARMTKTLDFIENYLVDKDYGEWYWGIAQSGQVSPHGTNKGELWKASYHNLRALVFASDWITHHLPSTLGTKQPAS